MGRTEVKAKGLSSFVKQRPFWNFVAGYGFVLPALVLIVAFIFVPAIYGFLISLTKWDTMSPIRTFVGFSNYYDLLKFSEIWHSLFITLYYLVRTILITMALGLALFFFNEGLWILRRFAVPGGATEEVAFRILKLKPFQ
ncbi:MAG: hypothetical protein QME90_13475 [Thermodesulfobacteriota bacterium]|nr:hypothetical protein [Thermodesulfobacteriota bacterium]